MSELVLVFPVIALTVIVLLWLMSVFAKYLRARDALDAAEGRAPRAAAPPALTTVSPFPERARRAPATPEKAAA
jgi:hypothetical protein